ncbi:DUF4214 domain-containing protein [Duganella sp. CT11-25]|uniref:DUF4214 domain-containing protein n=1 Tax=unclassified Duganella TaxID=2636909 RepID=UPI0039B0B483
MAAAPLITQLSFPKVIDVTSGSSLQTFSVTLAQGALGPGAHVAFMVDYLYAGFDIGGNGESLDTFTDSTPNYASSTYEFSGGYPVGEYAIRLLYIWDDSGQRALYSAADLQAMGLQSSFTIIDHLSPAAPTLSVDVGAYGLVDGQNVVLYGTAGAGQVVDITYFLADGYPLLVGSATADASGHWRLAPQEWGDGHYSGMVASVSSGGHVSALSTALDFDVQQAPAATAVQLAHGTDGTVNAAKPLIWGTTTFNSAVTIYDGGKAIATVHADEEGWWGLSPGTLATGAHQLTAQVQDQFGRVSPLSAPLDVRVATPTAGISYTVGSVNNETGQAFDVSKLQALLDAVSALTSSVLDGTQNISLTVSIQDLEGSGPIAARATFHHAASEDAMPTVSGAALNLSPAVAKAINDGTFLTGYAIEVFAHEMLHVLGITSDPSSDFHAQTKMVGTDAYYFGFNALALNGGAVLLSPDAAHVAAFGDLMAPEYQRFLDYFTPANPASPYSALDLAILKELGYHNTDTLVSEDGHRYLAGNGKPGHNTVTGIAGTDTLYLDGTAAGRTIKATATGYSVQDNTGNGGTLQLSGIERIYFDNKPVALDVGAGEIGGVAYRMYQAAFNRAPDSDGLGFWIDQMDHGLSLQAVARLFKSSPEFVRLYGADLSDTDYITQLYSNVLHRKPDAEGQAFWLDKMQHGYAQEDVLMYFSESPENVAQLVGVLQNGFTYTYTTHTG